jgi:hypothetical protein
MISQFGREYENYLMLALPAFFNLLPHTLLITSLQPEPASTILEIFCLSYSDWIILTEEKASMIGELLKNLAIGGQFGG